MKLNKNLNYKQKILIGFSINILILFIVSFFFVFSYFNKVRYANTMLQSYRVDFAIKLIKEEKFSKISKRLSDIDSDLTIIDRAFIDENNKLEFITLIEGLADNNGVTLDLNINFDQIDSDKTVPMSISLKGSYNNIMNTLVSIENLKYYIDIKKIDLNQEKKVSNRLSSPDEKSNNNSLSMKISALSYWK